MVMLTSPTENSVLAQETLLAEIRQLRGRITEITGVVVATIDGMLVAHDSECLQVLAFRDLPQATAGARQDSAQVVAGAEHDVPQAIAGARQDTAAAVQPETLAAMSAAQLGLGQQIAALTCSGDFRESVTAASGGYVATFAAGPAALLTVIGGPELNLARLYHEARPVAARVGALIPLTF